ncbi:18066_t:CDS:2, partial [Gigaspora margarita]
NHCFYWRTIVVLTRPLVLFNFQYWMLLVQFEQIVLFYTLMMACELDTPNLNDPLYSVHSSKNKISGCCKIPYKPYPVEQEWKTVADNNEIEKNCFASDYGSTTAYICAYCSYGVVVDEL